ncbi:hypothetical protein MSAN_01211400 [Mycena sanguinolenta]|uniref:Uncharacterized protein n=1 Tax=Mycena sanguinolenta TaxID=230812 RepID=A0A8H6YGU6_9AGAR|nr:hypothetical protein MSAN_01211400 [Mycena sanguinolenta]
MAMGCPSSWAPWLYCSSHLRPRSPESRAPSNSQPNTCHTRTTTSLRSTSRTYLSTPTPTISSSPSPRNRPEVVDWILIHSSMLFATTRRMRPYIDPNGMGDMRDNCAWFTAVAARRGEVFVPAGQRESVANNLEQGYLPNPWTVMANYQSSKCMLAPCDSAEGLRCLLEV